MQSIILFVLLINIASNIAHAGSGASTPRPTPTRGNSLVQSFIEVGLENEDSATRETNNHNYIDDYNYDDYDYVKKDQLENKNSSNHIINCHSCVGFYDDIDGFDEYTFFIDTDATASNRAFTPPINTTEAIPLSPSQLLSDSFKDKVELPLEIGEENCETCLAILLRRQMQKPFNKRFSPSKYSQSSPASPASPTLLGVYVVSEKESDDNLSDNEK